MGFNVSVIQGLKGLNILRAVYAAIPFCLLLALALILIVVITSIVTVLPNMMGS